MKKTYLLAAATATALLGACAQTQQMAPETDIPTSEIPAEPTNATTTEEVADETQESAEQSTKHVCSGILICKLGLCPNGRNYKKKQGDAEETTEEETTPEEQTEEQPEEQPEESEDEDEAPVPSQEQMDAAQKLLNEQQDKPKSRKKRNKTKRTVVEEEEFTPEPAYENTSGIPGRSGLRMGRFAPPEEAASRSDNNLPLPNAAERHGLRSPKLPKALPMSIEGKTNH